MNVKSTVSKILLVAGIALLVLFVVADWIGIGENPEEFGPIQITGIVVGIILAVAGWVLLLRSRPQTRP